MTEQTYVYDSGLTFSIILKENLEALVALIKENKVGLILIDGGLGQGKTTLAVQIAEYLQALSGVDKEFDYEKQIGIGGGKFIKCADFVATTFKGVKGIPIIYDEAGDLSKRGSMTDFNKSLLRFFETYRVYGVVPIMCLPKFWELDNHIFALEIPQILLNCYDRSQRQGNYRAYDIQAMYYIKHHASKMIFKPQAYSKAQPTFYGHFLNLTPDKAKKLDKISIAGKKAVLRKAHIDLENLIDIHQLAQRTGYTINTLRQTLSQRRITPQERIGNKNYYNKNLIFTLARGNNITSMAIK